MPIDVAARVISNSRLSADYNVVALEAPDIAAAAIPGQFVMVKAASGVDPLLRRPFSVFEVLRDSSGSATGISILNKRIGVSTRLLYQVNAGDIVMCLGPLGQPFTAPAPPAEAWMVAGGVGLAPFAELARVLVRSDIKSTLFYGARTAAELFYLDYFRDLGVKVVITTEDGSSGERGRILRPLDRELAGKPVDSPVMLYACGPEGMLAACARTAATHHRPCEVSVERIMGCGMGGCYSCVVPMRSNGGWHHVRSCLSGPVLAADRIKWD